MRDLSSPERLHRLLDDGSEFTLKELSERLNVGERQVRRILGELTQRGIQVRERFVDGRKYICLDAEHQRAVLHDLSLSQEELRALTVAVKASRAVLSDTPHARPLGRVFQELLERFDPAAYVFDVGDQLDEWQFADGATDRIAQEAFAALDAALRSRQAVCIDYDSGKGAPSRDRPVEPYCFTKQGRGWLMVAYCRRRRALRTFTVGRVSRVVPISEDFYAVPDDFSAEEYFRGTVHGLTSDAPDCYRWLVEPEQARFFRTRQYHPSQIIEEDERDDGRLVVSFELASFEEARAKAQEWGTGVTVLDPPAMRERLREEAETLARRYADGRT
ncbi:MAG: WYL domain-containing protein [Catalinimonas sp.]